MKTSIKKTLAVTALAFSSGLFAVNSYALSINATFGAALGLNSFTTSSGVNAGNIHDATTIAFSDLLGDGGRADFTVSNIPATAYGSPNDFSGIPASISTSLLSPSSHGHIGDGSNNLTIMTGAISITDFMTWTDANSNNWHFSVSSEVQLPSVASTLDTVLLGIFHDANGVYQDSAASFHLTANQNQGGGLSVSGTWSSPPEQIPHNSPEPVTLSMLGLGLFGWAASRRKAA